jgi:hypothetical protein
MKTWRVNLLPTRLRGKDWNDAIKSQRSRK